MMDLKQFNAISKPAHYTLGRKYEPVKVIADWDLNFNTGNALKYISRAGRKDTAKTIEDLEKAIQYLEFEIQRISGEWDEDKEKLAYTE